jgi:putative hydrolase of the HAD superfamily
MEKSGNTSHLNLKQKDLSPDFLSGIDNIIFDLGGVIVRLNETLTKDAFFDIIGLSEISGTEYTKFFHMIEVGAISEQGFRDELKKIAINNGKSEPSDTDLDYAWNVMILKIPPANIALLKELSKKYNIYLLSNTNSIHLEYFKENAFFEGMDFSMFEKLFIDTHYSHLIEARKPDREAYQVVLDKHNLDANKTLFLDDNAPNFKGAFEAGIYCHHLTTPLTSIGLDLKN